MDKLDNIVVELSPVEAEAILGFVGEILDDNMIGGLARETLDSVYTKVATKLQLMGSNHERLL
jgi:hypothetical protein